MNSKIDQVSFNVILQVIYDLYGYDFRHYCKASLKRRLEHHCSKQALDSLTDMIPLLIKEPHSFDELLRDLSITVTEMFRDSYFYRAFCRQVMPALKTYPYIKIWHAGCATGEEVYSMAILLYEHDFLERSQLYGTDFNPYAIKAAKKGIYPDVHFKKYNDNYLKVSGIHQLKNYFLENYGSLKVRSCLSKRIAFLVHNLATDHSFGEVEVIVCRNVMIYFDDVLRDAVLTLFTEALVDYGYLCLGDKEMLDLPNYKCIDVGASIYQKVPL